MPTTGGRNKSKIIKGKGEVEPVDYNMEGSGIISGLLSTIGLGKGGAEMPATGGRRHNKSKIIKGKGEAEPIEIEQVPNMEGSGILSGLLSDIGLGKKTKGIKKSMGKGINDMNARVVGGKKKPSAWIMHVKAYAKKHGMKYPEALKDAKCKASYK